MKLQRKKRTLGVVVLAAAGLAACDRPATSTPAPGDGWLSGAPDQATRDERLERYLRGFDQPMWEVGERYRHVEQALRDENWALAAYHWEKIRTTIEGGLMKRPKRRPNAEALFLGEPWKAMHEALESRDPARIAPAFARAKGACMACHAAEKVPFINDQPLFREPLPLPHANQ
ncbi:TPA: hypothetical protein ACKR7L_001415 [Pseudomonas aeruginosa]|nr:hypothetical protein [Pseudomonas aeruginosa]HEJ2659846.1 hypothetical protein [Pseudomonas aeruginosa]